MGISILELAAGAGCLAMVYILFRLRCESKMRNARGNRVLESPPLPSKENSRVVTMRRPEERTEHRRDWSCLVVWSKAGPMVAARRPGTEKSR
jgi:hypothetical protein